MKTLIAILMLLIAVCMMVIGPAYYAVKWLIWAVYFTFGFVPPQFTEHGMGLDGLGAAVVLGLFATLIAHWAITVEEL